MVSADGQGMPRIQHRRHVLSSWRCEHPTPTQHMGLTQGLQGAGGLQRLLWAQWQDTRAAAGDTRGQGLQGILSPAPRENVIQRWLKFTGLRQCNSRGTEMALILAPRRP